MRNNQDLIVIVDDHHNRRGTGKTALSIGLAEAMDRTDEGLTYEKCTLSPEELPRSYVHQPKGAALVFDEAEVGASKYRAGSATNMAVRRLVSMGRVLEKYVVINLPNQGELDRDLKALCDVWVMVENKGEATVHFLGWNPYREKLLTPIKGTLRWTDVTRDRLANVYDELADEKMDHLHGDEGAGFVEREELVERIDHAKKDARTETRNDLIRDLYHSTDLTQEAIAGAVGLSRSRIGDIVVEDRAPADD